MTVTLLEINDEGQAVAWEGDLKGVMDEAFQIISERITSCGTLEESMKLLIKHLDAWKCDSFRYAFTIEEEVSA